MKEKDKAIAISSIINTTEGEASAARAEKEQVEPDPANAKEFLDEVLKKKGAKPSGTTWKCDWGAISNVSQ